MWNIEEQRILNWEFKHHGKLYDEEKFVQAMQKTLKRELKDYDVVTSAPLIYKVQITHEGKCKPNNPLKPMRGDFAFQTDLLVVKNNLPLVVVEAKFGGFSTHDVITYSNKAVRHKEIYPHLRYGMVIGKCPKITNRFLHTTLDWTLRSQFQNQKKMTLTAWFQLSKCK